MLPSISRKCCSGLLKNREVTSASSGVAASTNGDDNDASSSSTYDLIVVGAGSAGLTAAKLATETLGKSCCLVEQGRLGGDCTWTGCLPSKSLIAAAKAVHGATTKFGFIDNDDRAKIVDFQRIKQQIEHNQRTIYEQDDSPETLRKLGIDVIKGKAFLQSSDQMSVELNPEDADDSNSNGKKTRQLIAKEGMILCTGASPAKPLIDGIDAVEYLTYEGVWNDLDKVPATLTVVGGGPIGCELAQAFQRLGSQVTLVASRLLPSLDDADASRVMEEVFAREGITVVKGRVKKVSPVGTAKSKSGQHTATIALVDSKDVECVDGDEILVAVGRVPRVNGFGLAQVGVELNEKGGIQVNDNLETSLKGVFAAGDCTGDVQL